MPSKAYGEFQNLLGSVDQLINIHRKLQKGRGRRHEQDAVHRAGVVLTVAAWQAYIEKVLKEGLGHIQKHIANPPSGGPPPAWALSGFLVRATAIKNSIRQFNTPNSENVQRLFKESLEFDPWPSWTWHVSRRNWDSIECRNRTNVWLRIRHSIAHGFDLPDDVPWIQGDNGTARLTLSLLEGCRKHFDHLAKQTDKAFSDHLRDHHGTLAPW